MTCGRGDSAGWLGTRYLWICDSEPGPRVDRTHFVAAKMDRRRAGTQCPLAVQQALIGALGEMAVCVHCFVYQLPSSRVLALAAAPAVHRGDLAGGQLQARSVRPCAGDGDRRICSNTAAFTLSVSALYAAWADPIT